MTENHLSGNLQETPFAEIAGRLFQEKRSGTLSLTSEGRKRAIVFYEGNPVAVLSDEPQDHIAAILESKGKISAEDAAKLRELPGTKSSLQSADFLDKGALTWGLKYRFVNLCYDIFRWTSGDFSFEEGQPPADTFLMKVPTPTLLSKGIKHMPPSAIMDRVHSSLEVGGVRGESEALKALGEDEKSIAGICREGMPVKEAVDGSSFEAMRTREIIYVLTALGVVDLRTPSPEALPGDEAAAAEAAPLEEPGEAAAEEEPVFEIERHAYEEPPAAAETSAELAPPPDAGAAEPAAAEGPPGLQPIGFEQEAPPELGPPSLDSPPPPDSESEGAAEPFESLVLDNTVGGSPAGEDSAKPDVPPPGPNLPPPPWQTDTDAPEKGEAEGSSLFMPPEAETESRKLRSKKAPPPRRSSSTLKGIMLLAVLGAAGIAGWGLWMKSGSLRSPAEPLPPIPPAAQGEDVEMAEGLPVPALPKAPAKEPETGGAPQGGEVETAAVPPAEPAPEAAAPEAAVPEPEPEPEPAPPAAAEADGYGEGLAAYRAGDLAGAARIWKSMLAGSGAAYTIQVEVACQPATVEEDFQRFGTDRGLFTLPLRLKGKDCYRVMLGSFASQRDANRALNELPAPLRRDLNIRTVKSVL